MRPSDEFDFDDAVKRGASDDFESPNSEIIDVDTPLAPKSASSEHPISAAKIAVETIREEDGLRALEPEWIALEDEACNTLPFRTTAWALVWWKHLRRQSSVIQS